MRRKERLRKIHLLHRRRGLASQSDPALRDGYAPLSLLPNPHFHQLTQLQTPTPFPSHQKPSRPAPSPAHPTVLLVIPVCSSVTLYSITCKQPRRCRFNLSFVTNSLSHPADVFRAIPQARLLLGFDWAAPGEPNPFLNPNHALTMTLKPF